MNATTVVIGNNKIRRSTNAPIRQGPNFIRYFLMSAQRWLNLRLGGARAQQA